MQSNGSLRIWVTISQFTSEKYQTVKRIDVGLYNNFWLVPISRLTNRLDLK